MEEVHTSETSVNCYFTSQKQCSFQIHGCQLVYVFWRVRYLLGPFRLTWTVRLEMAQHYVRESDISRYVFRKVSSACSRNRIKSPLNIAMVDNVSPTSRLVARRFFKDLDSCSLWRALLFNWFIVLLLRVPSCCVRYQDFSIIVIVNCDEVLFISLFHSRHYMFRPVRAIF
jgi:hypothetical protein